MGLEERIEELETALKSAATLLASARLVFFTEDKFGGLPEALKPLDEEFKKELLNIKSHLK